jgi:2-polyprenyl-3-methyl-5-hydroxy-6-metoxy-1,4-benzoquinol methylase
VFLINLHRENVISNVAEKFLVCVEMYEQAGEPLKALVLLGMPPVVLQNSPALKAKRAELWAKIDHAFSFERYSERYANDERKPLSDDGLRTLPRYAIALDMMASLNPTSVASIGPGEGSIEAEMLERCVGLSSLLLIDVTYDGLERVAAALRERYPGTKIQTFTMKDFTAFPPSLETDVVWCTEVLEHVPNPGAYLKELCGRMKPGQHLILSTPDASIHFEPGITEREEGWYWHISAQTPASLSELLREAGFEAVRTASTIDGSLIVLAKVKA